MCVRMALRLCQHISSNKILSTSPPTCDSVNSESSVGSVHSVKRSSSVISLMIFFISLNKIHKIMLKSNQNVKAADVNFSDVTSQQLDEFVQIVIRRQDINLFIIIKNEIES